MNPDDCPDCGAGDSQDSDEDIARELRRFIANLNPAPMTPEARAIRDSERPVVRPLDWPREDFSITSTDRITSTTALRPPSILNRLPF